MDKEALERRLAAIFEEAEEAGIHLDSKPERVPVSRRSLLRRSPVLWMNAGGNRSRGYP